MLVDNAIRYTPEGGRVSVIVRRDDDAAVLHVEDTGIGMTVEDRERAFERFYRGTKGRKFAPDGSGLGLAIAAWVAARHEATITLDAATPSGTSVTVRFPLMTGALAVTTLAGSHASGADRPTGRNVASSGVVHSA